MSERAGPDADGGGDGDGAHERTREASGPQKLDPRRAALRAPGLQPTAAPSALPAFYGKWPAPSERAQLTVASSSLEFSNPFVGSPLLPPPPKRRPWLRPMLVLGAAGVLLGAGYAGAVWRLEKQAQANGLVAVRGEPAPERVPSVQLESIRPLIAGTLQPAAAEQRTGHVASAASQAGLVAETVPQLAAAAEPDLVRPVTVKAQARSARPATARGAHRTRAARLRAARTALPSQPSAAADVSHEPVALPQPTAASGARISPAG